MNQVITPRLRGQREIVNIYLEHLIQALQNLEEVL